MTPDEADVIRMTGTGTRIATDPSLLSLLVRYRRARRFRGRPTDSILEERGRADNRSHGKNI